MPDTSIVIPVAGRGRRFSSSTPKQLQLVNGRPVIEWIIQHLNRVVEPTELILVTNRENDHAFRTWHTQYDPRANFKFIEDNSYGGSAAAVNCALAYVTAEKVLVVWGDHPGVIFVPESFFETTIRPTEIGVAPVVLKSSPYVILERDATGLLRRFIEASEVSRQGLTEGLSDCGTFLLATEHLRSAMNVLLDAEATGEQNLIELLAMSYPNRPLRLVAIKDVRATYGINTASDLEDFRRSLK